MRELKGNKTAVVRKSKISAINSSARAKHQINKGVSLLRTKLPFLFEGDNIAEDVQRAFHAFAKSEFLGRFLEDIRDLALRYNVHGSMNGKTWNEHGFRQATEICQAMKELWKLLRHHGWQKTDHVPNLTISQQRELYNCINQFVCYPFGSLENAANILKEVLDVALYFRYFSAKRNSKDNQYEMPAIYTSFDNASKAQLVYNILSELSGAKDSYQESLEQQAEFEKMKDRCTPIDIKKVRTLSPGKYFIRWSDGFFGEREFDERVSTRTFKEVFRIEPGKTLAERFQKKDVNSLVPGYYIVIAKDKILTRLSFTHYQAEKTMIVGLNPLDNLVVVIAVKDVEEIYQTDTVYELVDFKLESSTGK